MSEPLCADCGQLPADMCFTVCGLCWNKAYPEQKQNIATQGDNPISITGDTPTAEALEWVRPYCLVHAILTKDGATPCIVCVVTARSLDAFAGKRASAASARVYELTEQVREYHREVERREEYLAGADARVAELEAALRELADAAEGMGMCDIADCPICGRVLTKARQLLTPKEEP